MLDREHLTTLVSKNGPCMRVITLDVQGSGPREIGAEMLIWPDGQSGTIGGGTLEFEATKTALDLWEKDSPPRVTRHPLGPALGQCCGGAVTLLTEQIDQKFLGSLDDSGVLLRRITGDKPVPFGMQRQKSNARAQGTLPELTYQDGWLIEPLAAKQRPLWIWGAGHVGRALVDVLAPLPDMAVTWVDTDQNRFPEDIPQSVTQLVASDPTRVVAHAPSFAEHLIVTFSHALDLGLCHHLLQHDFAFAGLIGSKTKWARFQKRLTELGHAADQISRITCPIGDPSLGKHPQMIAIGVAAKLLSLQQECTAHRDRTA
ncbi:MAG: xanthine dehydrogenase accessory protein XdhC [Cognatishimia sp.]|uniref:xanthine dehydrogenase accessory protein XdhC n=1 Tax=Cognatishimia sp. TaxID=2211648 RepID=UPI003B8ABFA0